jgi:hypothetical protein
MTITSTTYTTYTTLDNKESGTNENPNITSKVRVH